VSLDLTGKSTLGKFAIPGTDFTSAVPPRFATPRQGALSSSFTLINVSGYWEISVPRNNLPDRLIKRSDDGGVFGDSWITALSANGAVSL
jgi:hypothetical protein